MTTYHLKTSTHFFQLASGCEADAVREVQDLFVGRAIDGELYAHDHDNPPHSDSSDLQQIELPEPFYPPIIVGHADSLFAPGPVPPMQEPDLTDDASRSRLTDDVSPSRLTDDANTPVVIPDPDPEVDMNPAEDSLRATPPDEAADLDFSDAFPTLTTDYPTEEVSGDLED